MNYVSDMYKDGDANPNDNEARQVFVGFLTMQIWHTPTELFKPFYGQAIARYILQAVCLVSYEISIKLIHELQA
jgi:hypothetical protein